MAKDHLIEGIPASEWVEKHPEEWRRLVDAAFTDDFEPFIPPEDEYWNTPWAKNTLN